MLLPKLTLASAALITVGVTGWAASAAVGIDKGVQDAVAVAVTQAPKTTRPLVLPGFHCHLIPLALPASALASLRPE